MKLRILILLSIFWFAPQVKGQTNKVQSEETINSKIVELAERYNELGRFSGSILIDRNDEIILAQGGI